MKKQILAVLTAILIISLPESSYAAGYFSRGKTYYVYRKYDKAKEMFLKVIEKREHGDSYYFLGEIEKLQGRYKEAMEYYQKAATLNTTKKYKKNAYWNLIVLAEMSGDYKYLIKTCIYMWEKLRDSGAKSKIEHIINKSLWSDNREAVLKYKSAMKYKKNNNADKAVELFKESIALDPSFLAPKFELGMSAYKQNRISEALEYLNEIASRIPFYADLHLILGEIEFKNKNYSSAITHFDSALEYGFLKKQTKYIIKLKRGTSYYNLGELEKAEEDINDALNYNSKSSEALTLLAAINIKSKKYDKALALLLKARRLERDNPFILYKIGSIYYKKNDSAFIRYFDRLFDLTVNLKEKSGKRYYRAFKIIIVRHFKKRNFSRVIKIAETIPDILNSGKHAKIIAKSYFYTGRYKKSIEIFEKISLEDDDKFILCKAYSRNKMKEKARNLLAQLIENNKYYVKAKKDPRLNRIIREIETDRKKEEINNAEKKDRGETKEDAGK